jgi:hypothetical protein
MRDLTPEDAWLTFFTAVAEPERDRLTPSHKTAIVAFFHAMDRTASLVPQANGFLYSGRIDFDQLCTFAAHLRVLAPPPQDTACP